MPKLNMAPTKSNQLALRRQLALASQGFNLLEQKREILVMGLMRLMDRVKAMQVEVEERTEKAYRALRFALVRHGYHDTRNIASTIHYDHDIRITTHVTAGVRTPAITMTQGEFTPQFSFAATDSTIDKTMAEFLELSKTMARLAEMESSVWLMARELKKTQRRVNALEHIFLPEYKETLHYISESLESKELDTFFSMKMIKKKLDRAASDQPSPEK